MAAEARSFIPPDRTGLRPFQPPIQGTLCLVSQRVLGELLACQVDLVRTGDQDAAFKRLLALALEALGAGAGALGEVVDGRVRTWRAEVGGLAVAVRDACARASISGSGDTDSAHGVLLTSDGEVVGVLVVAHPADAGPAAGYDGILDAVTALIAHSRREDARQAAEDEIRGARTRAESASAAKNVFLSRMSHEIRTPLNAMLGFAQLIQIRSASPAERRDAERIISAGRHLMTLLDEVMDVSSIEQGRIALGLVAIDMRDFVAESLSLLSGPATERSVDIQFARQASPVAHVLGDPARLRQVIINLVDNAVKYNRLGGTVTVRLELFDDQISVDIEDEGRGIPEDRFDRVFEAFERLDAPSLGIPGSGLGLAVARSLARAMRGDVMLVASRPGRTVFRLTLPTCSESAAALPPLESVSPSRDVSGRVLYVEDNPTNALLVQSMVEQLLPHVDITIAHDGREALQRMAASDYDAILLDLHLPDIRAEDVIDARTGPSPCPVYIVTADATVETRRLVMALPVDGLMVKPVSPARLATCLTEALRRRAQGEVSALDDSR